MTSYRSQFPTVGPQTIKMLNEINVSSQEELIELGAEEAFKKYFLLQGGRQPGMCSCIAYSFEGIIRNCKWFHIPMHRKKSLKAYVHELRR